MTGFKFYTFGTDGARAKLWQFSGPGGQGLEKVSILLQKAHLYVDPRRLSHFAWKLVRGVGSGKNKVTHRNEVSPLTQGLNYRSACDK